MPRTPDSPRRGRTLLGAGALAFLLASIWARHASRTGRISREEQIGLVVVAGVVVVVWGMRVVSRAIQRRSKRSAGLARIFVPSRIEQKAARTRELLETIARVDGAMAIQTLLEAARSAFWALHGCWRKGRSEGLEALLLPDLLKRTLQQLQAMRPEELERMAGLSLETVDVVGVHHEPDRREFTALVTVRERAPLKDQDPGWRSDPCTLSQELWTFHRRDGAWLLAEMEPANGSDILERADVYRAAAG